VGNRSTTFSDVTICVTSEKVVENSLIGDLGEVFHENNKEKK